MTKTALAMGFRPHCGYPKVSNEKKNESVQYRICDKFISNCHNSSKDQVLLWGLLFYSILYQDNKMI